VIKNRRPPADMIRATRLLTMDSAGRRLCVDEYGLRYVFDFRPPQNYQDWVWRNSITKGWLTRLSEKSPDDIWVVNTLKLEFYVQDSGVRAERASLLGHSFGS